MEFGVIVYLFTGLREWGVGAMYPPPTFPRIKMRVGITFGGKQGYI